MKRKLAVWKLINQSLKANIPIILLYVLESKGSSPGRQGFSMAVNAAGDMEGPIGGGIMEHKFVELAKQKLMDGDNGFSIRKQIHDKSSAQNQSGMICSGEQTILIYQISLSDTEFVKQLIVYLENSKMGELCISPDGLRLNEAVTVEDFEYTFQSETQWFYKEKIGRSKHLYIIGAGHCSLALSRIMSTMDFYIHLYDDRPQLNTFLSNVYTNQKLIVADYAALEAIDFLGDDNYIVVMTFGYRTDNMAVKALINKPFKYFGLLGSKTKVEKMFADYKSNGIDEKKLLRIHAPVGLDIKSETPEEIAISIAAEIIKIKNKS